MEIERKRQKKLEEKREHKKQQALLAERLRAIATQRQEEAERLMKELITMIAEEK